MSAKNMSAKSVTGDCRGFTLVELLIVIGIIAILAAIGIPQFLKYKMRAHDTVLSSDIAIAYTAAQAYLIGDPSAIVDSLAKLNSSGYKSTPEVVFASANMTTTSGSVKIVSTMAVDSKNVATVFFNGNIEITPN